MASPLSSSLLCSPGKARDRNVNGRESQRRRSPPAVKAMAKGVTKGGWPFPADADVVVAEIKRQQEEEAGKHLLVCHFQCSGK